MAIDFTGWTPLSGRQSVQNWLDDGYANYLVEHSQQDGAGPPMSREQWSSAGTSGFNIPAGADLNNYGLNFYSSDGSQWDGQLGINVSDAAGDSVSSQSWDAGGRWDLGDVALRAGALFGGSALLAQALAGAAAAGGAGGASGVGSLGGAAEGVTALGQAWSPQALGLTTLAPSTAAVDIAALASALPGAVGAGAGLGSLGSLGGEGISALGSSWSPQALGLTEAVAPAITSSELAALGTGIPSLTPGIGEMALNGAIKGGVKGGATSLIKGENPLEGALKGAVGGGITGGITGGVNAINPDGVGWVNNGISGGLNAAVSGGNPLIGAAGGAVGPLLGSLGQTATTTPTAGGNMDFGGVSGWFDNWTPDDLNLTTDIAGNVLPSLGTDSSWMPNWDSWVNDALIGAGTGWTATGLPSWLESAASAVKGGLGGVASAVGGGGNLAALIGAGLGAASGGGTQTQSRDPWSAAQPFLKNILGDADAMRANLAANPFTQQQTQAYSNAYGGLDQARAALPGLLSWGQNAMQRQSSTPTYASLFGGGQPQQSQQPQQAQPTMQAGGVGGLLGGAPEDRLKALMAGGRGLLG